MRRNTHSIATSKNLISIVRKQNCKSNFSNPNTKNSAKMRRSPNQSLSRKNQRKRKKSKRVKEERKRKNQVPNRKDLFSPNRLSYQMKSSILKFLKRIIKT
jgi:hypothetical protein